jgi:hypothetical protein
LDKVCELEKYPSEVQQVEHTDQRQTELNYRRIRWLMTPIFGASEVRKCVPWPKQ